MAHKTLVNGTAYEVSGGRTLVNGTGYSIDKGKTLVNGTAYTIDFDSKDKHVNSSGEILDSWAVISAGTYKHYYSIGNYKTFSTTSGVTITMEIIAFDTDYCQDGTYAPITWLQKDIYWTGAHSSSSNMPSYGWVNSAIRARLQSGGNIYNQIPSEVMNVIKTVRKYDKYYPGSTSFVNTQYEKLWIPNHREIFGTSTYEHVGVIYSYFSTVASRRVKYKSGSAYNWHLKSVNDWNNGFMYVNTGGNSGTDLPNKTCGIVIGFCT